MWRGGPGTPSQCQHPIPTPAPSRHPSPSHHEHPGKQPLLQPPTSTGAAAPPRTAREGTWGAGDAPGLLCRVPSAGSASRAGSGGGAEPSWSTRPPRLFPEEEPGPGKIFPPPSPVPAPSSTAARAPHAPRVQLIPGALGAPAAGPVPSHPALDATQLPAGQKALESINIPSSDLIPLSALALAFYLVLIKPSLAPFKSPGRMAPAPARHTGAVGAGAEGAAGAGGAERLQRSPLSSNFKRRFGAGGAELSRAGARKARE